MSAAHAAPALPDDGEPTPLWAAEALGISLEDADWLLVLYRFAETDPGVEPEFEAGFRHRYFCEPL
jgi:hypothetical protein